MTLQCSCYLNVDAIKGFQVLVTLILVSSFREFMVILNNSISMRLMKVDMLLCS